MFIYFNEHKLAYHKGQLAPFFIVIIIVLIIASLITVNIGKVAKTKTYSANAVDAGALAGASTMASAFNYIAVANSSMIVNYEFFFAMASVSFSIAAIAMGVAIASTITAIVALAIACAVTPCCNVWPTLIVCCPIKYAAIAAAVAAMMIAETQVGTFIKTILSLMVQVTGYWITQEYFYKMIRETVDGYYDSALDSSYSFAFNNSGIGQKLSDSLQDDYMIWLRLAIKNVPSGAIKLYHWRDAPGRREGQRRNHDVATQVLINPVESYRLGKTVMGYGEEMAMLGSAEASAITASTLLATAIIEAEVSPCAALPLAISALVAEIAALTSAMTAHMGLIPGGSFTDSSGSAGNNIITWIEDVPHDGLVNVLQTQKHQGANLGMWTTEYPLVSSSSTGLFLIPLKGSIFPPIPEYDSTLLAVGLFKNVHLPPLTEPYPIQDVEDDLQDEMQENYEED